MLDAMMPLAQIHRLARTVDDAGRSPVADTVAAAWGYPPGAARLRRSSASHVFVVPTTPTGRVYLRFVPATHTPRARVTAVAQLMATLSSRGLAVVPLVPARSGALVETVSTALGDVHATVVEAAPGEQIDVDALTTPRAAHWGAALARLHRDGNDTGARLPGPFPELPRVATAFPDDPALVSATDRIIRGLDALPRDPDRFGTVHGDFELDNLSWATDAGTDTDTVVAYDFDEAAHSWYLADIAYAVRDLTPTTPAGTSSPGSTELFTAFLTAYRQIRPLPPHDLAHLPLFTAAHAACSAVRAWSAIDTRQPGDPPWLSRLHAKLQDYTDKQREIAVTTTP
jgi:Ser/Thr protein kinase RdoA (MazF antagonist)